MEAIWRETANHGRTLYLREQGLEVAHEDGGERAEASSLWHGIEGYQPHGLIAGWRWRRGLARTLKAIERAVKEMPIEPVT